jgi:hypothetical protein
MAAKGTTPYLSLEAISVAHLDDDPPPVARALLPKHSYKEVVTDEKVDSNIKTVASKQRFSYFTTNSLNLTIN